MQANILHKILGDTTQLYVIYFDSALYLESLNFLHVWEGGLGPGLVILQSDCGSGQEMGWK